MSYRIALERLLAYEPKKLIVGFYKNDDGCCVVGAILPSSRRHDSKDVYAILDDPVCRLEIQSMGLTEEQVTSMLDHNDSLCLARYSDKTRYEHMVEWLRSRDPITLPMIGSGEVDDAR